MGNVVISKGWVVIPKKDNNKDTPIEFDIPKWGTKGPRIPSPINQPNWKYTNGPTKPKLGTAEISLVGLILIIEAVLIISIMRNPSADSVFFAITCIWSLFTSLAMLYLIQRLSSNTEQKDENNKHLPEVVKKTKETP